MKSIGISILLLIALVGRVKAQELLSPSLAFSHNKTAYVTLLNGTEIKGNIKDIDRKKGLIKFVNIEDGNGKKNKLKAESIQYMYLPPSNLSNFIKAMDVLTDVKKWNDEKLNQDLLNQGYAYFENSKVKIKKKEMTLLMQLLNPSFSARVKVYHDPLAKETTSLGVGPLTVVGGDAKSYFIKVDNEPAAFKLEKKDYKKQFVPLWKKCDSVAKKYTNVLWMELTKHILDYTVCE